MIKEVRVTGSGYSEVVETHPQSLPESRLLLVLKASG